MGYINEKTGTTQGPIQLELNGPWLNHTIENDVHILNVQQFSGGTKPQGDEYVSDGMFIRVNLPSVDFSNEEFNLMIPNIAWVKSYAKFVSEGGDPIDISQYATLIQLNELKEIVNNNTEGIVICKAELTNISKDVKILVDWKSEIEESVLVLDGCKPDGTPHYTVD